MPGLPPPEKHQRQPAAPTTMTGAFWQLAGWLKEKLGGNRKVSCFVPWPQLRDLLEEAGILELSAWDRLIQWNIRKEFAEVARRRASRARGYGW